MCAICKIAQRYQKHRLDGALPTVDQLTRTVILSATPEPLSETAAARLSAQEKSH
ncbi:MAG: hypothetical protein AAGI69_13070 [Cyanobacteria bacterium P01_H01_bin.21]